jgi:hypothetical protein
MAREICLSLLLLLAVVSQSFAATDGEDQEAATSISTDEPAYIVDLRNFAEAHPGVPYPPLSPPNSTAFRRANGHNVLKAGPMSPMRHHVHS